MKRIDFYGFLALIPCLLFVRSVHAQSEFEEAHVKFAEFWNEASKITKDPAKREAIAKKTADLPETMNSLITNGIQAYLTGNKDVSTDRLADKIARSVAAPSLGDQVSADSVVSISSWGNPKIYVVAYDVTYCAACSTGWMGIFLFKKDHYLLSDSISNIAINQSIYLSKVINSRGRQFAILYGIHWGDAHNRLNVRVYDVSDKLREVWSLLDLPHGTIEIDANRMKLTYATALVPPFSEKSQIFEIANGKVKLSQTHTSSVE